MSGRSQRRGSGRCSRSSRHAASSGGTLNASPSIQRFHVRTGLATRSGAADCRWQLRWRAFRGGWGHSSSRSTRSRSASRGAAEEARMISAADFDDVFGPRKREDPDGRPRAPHELGAVQAEDEEVEAALVLREGVDHRADDYPFPRRRRLRDLRRIARSRVNRHLTRSGVIGQSRAKASNTSSPARSVALRRPHPQSREAVECPRPSDGRRARSQHQHASEKRLDR